MKDTIRESLELLQNMEFDRFFLPDGRQTPLLAPRISPGAPLWDRLVFMIDGEKFEPMSIDNKLCEVHLLPGDAWLVRRGIWEYTAVTTAHRFLSIVPRATYLRVVCYTLPPGLKPGDWRDPEVIHSGRPVPSRLQAVFQALGEAGAERGRHIPCLLRAVVEIVLQELEHVGKTAGKSIETFERVLRYITHHYMEPIDRNFVAGQFDLNGSYISQLLKEKLGMSFREYLTDLRISAAKNLLMNTGLSMKEIAEQCGFPDDVYFIYCFRKAVGMPPGRFRIAQKKTAVREG